MNIEIYAQSLYIKVRDLFGNKILNVNNVFDFIRISMEEAEKMTELTGRMKKELVIKVFNFSIENLCNDEIDKQNLRILSNNFIDNIINHFCDIDLHHLKINEDKKHRIRAFLKSCYPCCN